MRQGHGSGLALWLCSVGLALLLAPAAGGRTSGTLSLNASILWSGTGAACGGGFPPAAECHTRTSNPVAVPGLGFLSESYVYPIDVQPGSACPANTVMILPYTARLIVKDRGEILLGVPSGGCVEGFSTAAISATQTFRVTGGSGVFTGASGSGVVRRTQTQFATGTTRSSGVDTWEGTLAAPGFDPDTTAPTITGAVNKVVRARRKARAVAVRYQVAATDNLDGAVAVSCNPPSGSRFKVGRTLVRCSATDKSANTATATFTVRVRRSAKR